MQAATKGQNLLKVIDEWMHGAPPSGSKPQRLAHLVPGLRLLTLDDLQLLLVVGAHVTAPAQLPARVLHLAGRTKLRHRRHPLICTITVRKDPCRFCFQRSKKPVGYFLYNA